MELQHDPRTKQQIKDLLYAFLYKPVQAHYQDILKQIVHRNCLILGSEHPSFIYRGTVYTSDNNAKTPRKLNRLQPALLPAMNDYLKEVNQLNEYELPFVLGFINQVLNSSNDLQDYLLVLPESVHKPIHELIATCGCRAKHLQAQQIAELKVKNEIPIMLMKKRQVLNLLI